MKTKDSIHRFSAAALLSAAALFSVAFSSCSSDDYAPNPIPDVPAESDMATINLAFSAPSIESRADDESNGKARIYTDENGNTYDPVDTEAHETKIDNLWVYFFEVSGNSSKLWKAFDVVSGGTSTDYSSMTLPENISTDYETVISGINIPKGDYKIYVLANIKGYQNSDDKIEPSFVNAQSDSYKAGLETELLNYTFTTVNSENETTDAEGIIAGSLPMGANYTDITLSNVQGNMSINNNIITVDSGTGTIGATLTYLCAKVRYTLFFDNTVSGNETDGLTYGYSHPINKFEYEVIGVHNALTKAALFPDQYGNYAKFPMDVMEKEIIDDPEDQTKGFVASQYPNDTDLAIWFDKDNTTTSAKSLLDLPEDAEKPTTGKIAYQGLVYLPENRAGTTNSTKDDLNTKDYGNKTCLHLKVKLDGQQKDYVINLPDETTGTGASYLQHGNFYDIVCKITATGAEFNVKVKKWVKSTNNINQGI